MKSIQNIVLEVPTAQAQRFQQLTPQQKKVLSSFVADFLMDSEFNLRNHGFYGFSRSTTGSNARNF